MGTRCSFQRSHGVPRGMAQITCDPRPISTLASEPMRIALKLRRSIIVSFDCVNRRRFVLCSPPREAQTASPSSYLQVAAAFLLDPPWAANVSPPFRFRRSTLWSSRPPLRLSSPSPLRRAACVCPTTPSEPNYTQSSSGRNRRNRRMIARDVGIVPPLCATARRWLAPRRPTPGDQPAALDHGPRRPRPKPSRHRGDDSRAGALPGPRPEPPAWGEGAPRARAQATSPARRDGG